MVTKLEEKKPRDGRLSKSSAPSRRKISKVLTVFFMDLPARFYSSFCLDYQIVKEGCGVGLGPEPYSA